MTFGSLFAGIGGFDLGFERAGMQCKWQVEIDPYCQKVLAKHWPAVRRHDDIRTFPIEPIDDWRVDVICGGFPCQDISYAGKGAGLKGERSGLFYEAMRVIRILEPRIVVLENVAALLTRGLSDVLGTLASFGFDAEWHCIPAAAVGAPHIRDRVFILAYMQGVERRHIKSDYRISPQRESRVQSRSNYVLAGKVADTNQPRQQQSRESASVFNREPPFSKFRLGSAKPEFSQWATEPDVGRVANGVPNRIHRLKGLGNAVVPQVAEWIGKRIMECDA